MTKSQQILDIIDLKQKHNLLEDDFSWEKAVDWYDYALDIGNIITKYDGNKLVGFIEWVRLPEVPKSMKDIKLNYDIIKTGPVCLITNVIAPGNMMELKNKAHIINADARVLCWHNKKSGKIMVFKGGRL